MAFHSHHILKLLAILKMAYLYGHAGSYLSFQHNVQHRQNRNSLQLFALVLYDLHLLLKLYESWSTYYENALKIINFCRFLHCKEKHCFYHVLF